MKNTKAVSVNVQFHAPSNCLVLPDMNIQATISSRNNNVKALTVPLTSLIKEEDHNYVFATNESQKDRMQIEKFKVNISDRNNQSVEISFLNPVSDNILIASNDVMALEMERKKSNNEK